MQFRYKINLQVDVLFEAPLLGADTTIFGRERSKIIAKEALDSLLDPSQPKESSVTRIIEQRNLKAKVTGNTMFHSARGQSL